MTVSWRRNVQIRSSLGWPFPSVPPNFVNYYVRRRGLSLIKSAFMNLSLVMRPKIDASFPFQRQYKIRGYLFNQGYTEWENLCNTFDLSTRTKVEKKVYKEEYEIPEKMMMPAH